jgi:hypothetical protein
MPIRPVTPEQLQVYGVAIAVEGGVMAAYEYGVAQLKKQKFMYSVIKTLKNWTDAVLALIISVVSYAVLANTLPEYGVRAIRVLGSWGVKEAVLVGIRHRPGVVITDRDTVEVFGLDGDREVEVWIDDSKVSFTTPPKTDGAGHAEIKLPSALSADTHRVLVHTGFKSAYTEQYVE